jgi:hypothetical protein
VILETQAQRRTRFLRSVITFDTHRQFFTTWRTPPLPQLKMIPMYKKAQLQSPVKAFVVYQLSDSPQPDR